MRVVEIALALCRKNSPTIIKIRFANRFITVEEVVQMDKNSLSHTTWNCKYHIVFAPKLLLSSNRWQLSF